MLMNRIRCHRSFMLICSLIHLGIMLLVLIELLKFQKSNALQCTILHNLERSLYFASNFVLMMYFFHLYRHGRVQSMDIFIFDLQKRIALYGLFLPFGFAGLHNMSNFYFCRDEPFSFHATVFYFCHLSLEFLFLWGYFTWYQRELKRYSGEETQADEFSSRTQSSDQDIGGTTKAGDTLNN